MSASACRTCSRSLQASFADLYRSSSFFSVCNSTHRHQWILVDLFTFHEFHEIVQSKTSKWFGGFSMVFTNFMKFHDFSWISCFFHEFHDFSTNFMCCSRIEGFVTKNGNREFPWTAHFKSFKATPSREIPWNSRFPVFVSSGTLHWSSWLCHWLAVMFLHLRLYIFKRLSI